MDKLKKHRVLSAISLIALVSLLLVATPQRGAAFVLAYDYDPANNGNYIAYIGAYIDGVSNGTVYYNPVSYPNSTAVSLEVERGDNLTLAVFCWMNNTQVGASSLADGLRYIRHNITISTPTNQSVFSQQNFTYILGTDGNDPMYFYRHDVILDFDFTDGEIYTVVISYEVYS